MVQSGISHRGFDNAALLLVQFLEHDRRPTFVVDISNSTITYQNPACRTSFPDIPQRDWGSVIETETNDLYNIWTFCDKLWAPTVLDKRWLILSTCCRSDEIGPSVKRPMAPSRISSMDHKLEVVRSKHEKRSSIASPAEIVGIRNMEQQIIRSLESESVKGPPFSDSQYRRSFQTAPVGIYATNYDGEPLYCNDAYYRLVGKPRETDGSIPVFLDAVHLDDIEHVRLAKQQAVFTKKSVTLEYRLKRPWHTSDPISKKETVAEFWVLATIVPWLDDSDEERIQYVNGWLIDISAQKHHERRHVIAAQQEQSEARFTRMADPSPFGMYMLKPDLSPLYMNEACFEIFGTTREDFAEAERHNYGWLDFVHEESLEEVTKATQDLQASTSSQVTYRLKKPRFYTDPTTGSQIEGPRWATSVSIVEKNEAGDTIGVQGFIADVSAKYLSEHLLRQRLDEALETKTQADRFIDMVSHELRNPLSAILQSADGILGELERCGQGKSVDLAADAAETVVNLTQTIVHCGEHQKTIVDDVLTLSKLDSKLLTISPDATAMPSLIRKCFKMYAAETEAAQTEVSMNIDSSFQQSVGDREVMLDHSRVLQVIINLFSNAIKFTKLATTRKINISLGASTLRPKRASFVESQKDLDAHEMPTEEWGHGDVVFVQIAVSDTGRGIDHDARCQLFQRFSQASPKTFKQYGGSGLGLYISQSLTELQGGQIGVESRGIDQGSTFIFYVKARLCPPKLEPKSNPVSRTISPADSSVSMSAHRRVSACMFSDLHVLLAEDNRINQKVMSQQLRRFGCTVHIANHGLEALEFLPKTTLWNHNAADKALTTSKPPIPLTIILMDVEMPVLGGLECVEQIRQLQNDGKLNSHVPVIAITANARPEQIKTAIARGMDSVVTKPFRVSDIVPQMRELVHSVLDSQGEAMDWT